MVTKGARHRVGMDNEDLLGAVLSQLKYFGRNDAKSRHLGQ